MCTCAQHAHTLYMYVFDMHNWCMLCMCCSSMFVVCVWRGVYCVCACVLLYCVLVWWERAYKTKDCLICLNRLYADCG